jgi:hypothetical protein
MHAARFSQGNFGTALRRHPRRSHPATAATDDEQVKIKAWVGLHTSYSSNNGNNMLLIK